MIGDKTADTILVICSDKSELDVLNRDLQTLGYKTVMSDSYAEATPLLDSGEIGVVICSLEQHGRQNGVEILREVAAQYPRVERILLTEEGEPISFLEDDRHSPICSILSHPWELISLQYLIESSLEKSRLIIENRSLQKRLLRQHIDIAKYQKKTREEITVSGTVHKRMLVGKILEGIPGFKVSAFNLPAHTIEGDFFDFLLPADHTIDLIIGDVKGTGIPSVLIGTAIKTQFIRFAIPNSRSQVMVQGKLWTEDLFTPAEILERVHTEIVDQLIDLEYFTTIFYARFILKKRLFTYVDCGSTKPIYYNATKETVKLLRGENLPLGMTSNKDYKSRSILYNFGDKFIFYSDGIIESKNALGEMFGLERLLEIVKLHIHSKPDKLKDIILEAITTHSGAKVPEDDQTCIVIEMTRGIFSSAQKPIEAKFNTDLSQLEAVRKFVARTCELVPGNNEDFSNQMQLAINEIFCNIVDHGFNKKSFGEIVIVATLDQYGIWFDIADQGPCFEPSQVEEPSLAGDRSGGFGWYIVRNIADEVRYTKRKTDDGRNHLELYKLYPQQELPMEIDHKIENDIMVLTPKVSALDAKDVPEFKEMMLDIIQNENPSGIKKFVLNLEEVDFVDSSGLGSFLSVLRHLRDHGGSLRIANMKKSVRTIFELVSMHKVFEIHDTLEAAKQSFNP